MCIIIDTNLKSMFLNNEDEMKPVNDWLDKSGKLAYSPFDQIKKEFSGKYLEKIDELNLMGKVKVIKKNDVKEAMKDITESHELESDDPHILALAKVAKVKVIVTSDTKLHSDFKEILGGNIYQNETHKHLLDEVVCK